MPVSSSHSVSSRASQHTTEAALVSAGGHAQPQPQPQPQQQQHPHILYVMYIHGKLIFPVVQVQADVRTIISRDFATRHSLRFPRVDRIRYDKSPFDVQTDQELWDVIDQKGGVAGGRTILN